MSDLKNIREYFNYLFTLERSSMKYDLKNIRQLLKDLGNPHNGISFIHIAGTNGKGGTASFLASILAEQGLKTGLFTSPHILRYNERIRINGKTISDQYIKKFLDANEKLIRKVKPSFFEVNTAMAFRYFADKKVDVAVIETGLGGRLDSTNIIHPELAIITQIGIDHTDYLGTTLKSIAKEKLGIVKPGIDVIVADKNPELRTLFRETIRREHLYLLDAHSVYKTRVTSLRTIKFDTSFNLNHRKYHFKVTSPLPGSYQVRNINTAILASLLFLREKGIKLSLSAVRKGISNLRRNTGYRGRFEAARKNKTNFIFDISHNPAGIEQALSNFGNECPDVTVFAMMNDKNYSAALKILTGCESKMIFTQPDYKRALSANTLFESAKRIKPKAARKFYSESTVREAVKSAVNMAGNEGTVLVIGSFFLVSEAIRALKMQKHFR